MSEYKVGDRVKVTLEGEVTSVCANGFVLSEGYYFAPEDVTLTIERVVEVFKVGDRVVSRSRPSYEYTIGRDGYYSHEVNKWWDTCESFTSKHYELVYRSPEADDE